MDLDALRRPLAGGMAVSLGAAERAGVTGLARAPRTVKVLVENVLRGELSAPHERGSADPIGRCAALVAACAGDAPPCDVLLRPTRLILQDHTGVPVLSDFASLRSLMAERGLDPRAVRPTLPVDLVIDHSVEVDRWGAPGAVRANMAREFRLNRERYRFLRWAQEAIDGLRVVPPGRGIVHQMHLEHLARVVMETPGDLLAPDLVLGTDSHTPMVGGIGVLGWGVGGIEAETALLGHAVSLRSPQVLGVRLRGRLPVGSTASDLALRMTAFLRELGVVGRFVEFFGPGVQALDASDRATVANMAPEYGCTVAFFPVDEATVAYLRTTGRARSDVRRIVEYAHEQGLWAPADDERPSFAEVVEFDLASVSSTVAGPRRPQDALALEAVPASFGPADAGAGPVPDGSVALAAITSCTNTSNPRSMVTAGLVAREALRRGLHPAMHVKTSLAPGSRSVVEYLDAAGLLDPLRELGFDVAGFGCTTCIGNSGELTPEADHAVRQDGRRVAAVLSGNRNFEGRIHRDVSAAYLASPALVVAYALAGTVLTDLANEPLGEDPDGRAVFLADLWPSAEDIRAAAQIDPVHFAKERHDLFSGDEQWASLSYPTGPVYDWPDDSSYLVRSPWFDGDLRSPGDLRGARVLVFAGDSTTTDHISPAGGITAASPGGRYLTSAGVDVRELNSYGCRRGNHRVMIRGAFSNPKFRNRLTPDHGGSSTLLFPGGERTTVHEAAAAYADAGTPVVILAGRDYGFGSSRDWAAKAPALLGVRAVLAQSFERIHRANLIGMGIVPLEFRPGDGPDELGLTGTEALDITGLDALSPGGDVHVRAARADGTVLEWDMLVRIDTDLELDYVLQGGFLRAISRPLLDASAV